MLFDIFSIKIYGDTFMLNVPSKKKIGVETKELIDKLLLEKTPLSGIVIVAEVSETWLQNYVNKKYEKIDSQLKIDEMWSFIGNKKNNKAWIWLAIDKDTKEIAGVYIGLRDTRFMGFIAGRISSICHKLIRNLNIYSSLNAALRLKRILPSLLISNTFTFIKSPSFTTSVTFFT
mmetsp:Transcript_3131/g.1844  ORF Transcript_3131/g.1844 Transcript_3131/m.1844 type:complete len:175 (-) Transcript_3131:6545-7069(-)